MTTPTRRNNAHEALEDMNRMQDDTYEGICFISRIKNIHDRVLFQPGEAGPRPVKRQG